MRREGVYGCGGKAAMGAMRDRVVAVAAQRRKTQLCGTTPAAGNQSYVRLI